MSSKYIKVKVSATISTDFYLEVQEDTSKDDIIELAKKEVTIIPSKYPEYVNSILAKAGINLGNQDGMIKDWSTDNIEYTIPDETC